MYPGCSRRLGCEKKPRSATLGDPRGRAMFAQIGETSLPRTVRRRPIPADLATRGTCPAIAPGCRDRECSRQPARAQRATPRGAQTAVDLSLDQFVEHHLGAASVETGDQMQYFGHQPAPLSTARLLPGNPGFQHETFLHDVRSNKWSPVPRDATVVLEPCSMSVGSTRSTVVNMVHLECCP